MIIIIISQPLAYNMISKSTRIAQLVSHKALTDSRGYTPLHLAAYNGHDHCIEVLLKHTAFQHFSGNKFTPLHCAVYIAFSFSFLFLHS